MAARKLFIFKHDSELGNAPSHKLFETVRVEKLEGVNPPRSFTDYKVKVDKGMIPAGVTLIEKV